MSNTESPIWLIDRSPLGWWNQAARPQIKSFTPQPSESTFQDQEALLYKVQENRWLRETGVAAKDTRLTVIVPIHNEEAALPSTLASHMFMDIPLQAHVHFLYVVNGSTDNSSSITLDHLHRIHSNSQASSKYDTQETPTSLTRVDPQIGNRISQVQVGNVTFSFIETSTPGKSNALNIGNATALENGDPFCIVMDADTWQEPNTVREMYAGIVSGLIKGGKDVIFGQHNNEASSQSSAYKITHRIIGSETRTQEISENVLRVTGALMGWRTSWMESIGGVPSIKLEDYAIGLLGMSQGGGVENCRATNWGYKASSISDELAFKSRLMAGILQLRALYSDDPRLIEILEQKTYQARPFLRRVQFIFDRIDIRNPLTLLKALAAIAVNEPLILLAKKEVAKDPTSQTWKSLKTTK